MPTKKTRIAVIGAGRIGRVHAENIARLIPEAELVGVSDVKKEAADLLAKELGTKSHVDYHDFLNDPSIDAIAICSSTDTHAQIIQEAAKKKKHIFCEKPIDLNLEKIRISLTVVKESGVIFQLGFNRRFDPNFRRVAELVKKGELGTPQIVKITSRDPSPPPAEYVAVSGGMFLDMTIHDFDMARYLMGDEVVEVHTMGAVLIDPAIGKAGDVDTATIQLRYKSGALGIIDNCRKAVYGYDQRVEVFGSKGCAQASNVAPNNVQMWMGDNVKQDLPHHFFIERYREAYLVELREF